MPSLTEDGRPNAPIIDLDHAEASDQKRVSCFHGSPPLSAPRRPRPRSLTLMTAYGTKHNCLGAHGISGAERRPAELSTWRRQPPLDPKPTIGHLINDRLLPGGSDWRGSTALPEEMFQGMLVHFQKTIIARVFGRRANARRRR